MKLKLTLIIAAIAFVNCNTNENNEANSQTNTELENLKLENEKLKREKEIADSLSNVKKIKVEDKFLISNSKVGDFQIGEIVNMDISNGYIIEKATRSEFIEGDTYEYPILKMSLNGDLHLSVQTTSESKDDFENSPIQEITVISNKYLTNEGIGVGSTIKEFFEEYPNSELYHYVETNQYCIRNNSTTYFLTSEDFIGKIDWDNQESHLVAKLKVSDFKTDSKISQIIVY